VGDWELFGSESPGLTSIRIDDRSLTKGRLRRRQERDEPCNFLGLAEACDAERARHFPLGLRQLDMAFGGERSEP